MAKSPVKIEMDAANLSGAMRELSRLTGRSFNDVVRSETKAILQRAQSRVKSASKKSIEASIEKRPFFTLHETDYEARDRSNVKMTRNGFIKYSTDKKYPNKIWSEFEASKKESVARRLSAKGLQRKAFLQLAEKLSMNLDKIPGYVRKANVNGQDYPDDARAKSVFTSSGLTIECELRRTYGQGILGYIQSAMKGRVSYFRKNLRDGVFKKADLIAAKYPGLRTNG